MDVHADSTDHLGLPVHGYQDVHLMCPRASNLRLPTNEATADQMSTGFDRGMFLLMQFHDGGCTSPDDNPFGPCSNCRGGNKDYWEVCPVWPSACPGSIRTHDLHGRACNAACRVHMWL